MNMCTGFALGQALANIGKQVRICLDMVDTAPTPGQSLVIKDVTYQKSLRWTDQGPTSIAEFKDLVDRLRTESGVEYTIQLGPILEPRFRTLGLRAACPRPGCGLADKHGLTNTYTETRVIFSCPHHGPYEIHFGPNCDMSALELNTPLRNMVRNVAFATDPTTAWIQVVGRDYAGFYQEQLLWRPLHGEFAPVIIYSPLILDWSGAKVSKSLYLTDGAYNYLAEHGLAYLLSYRDWRASGRDVGDLYQIAQEWVRDSKRLFRDYTLYQLHGQLERMAEAIRLPENARNAFLGA
ncbi:MAG: hypothetical protein M1826_003808 [Phylliscum demangeonii]|nr:MAG: hypothetical protein M1826_003808 [Phylliscum demangeonii]